MISISSLSASTPTAEIAGGPATSSRTSPSGRGTAGGIPSSSSGRPPTASHEKLGAASAAPSFTSHLLPSEPHLPLNTPPRRLIPPQFDTSPQRPAGQRPPDTHGQAAAQRQTGCGVSGADEGDYDFGAASSLTRATTPWALSR